MNQRLMTPEMFTHIQHGLDLSDNELARLLDTDSKTIRQVKSGKKELGPRMARLMRAYNEGYTPPDWPN